MCRVDWGQFEYNKRYDYSYQNNNKKYYVNGQYGKTEFNKKQFDVVFVPDKVKINEKSLY